MDAFYFKYELMEFLNDNNIGFIIHAKKDAKYLLTRFKSLKGEFKCKFYLLNVKLISGQSKEKAFHSLIKDRFPDILGVNAELVLDVINNDTFTLPVVYCFILGYVKDLRKSMNIFEKYIDNQIVVMYGCTDNFKRKTGNILRNIIN